MSQNSINDFCTEFYALSYELRKGMPKPSRTLSNAHVPLAWGQIRAQEQLTDAVWAETLQLQAAAHLLNRDRLD